MIFLSKYKVCVYAISKYEEKFVERWVNSMQEADKIIVAGEALSHCVANTLRDLVVYLPAYKITVLTDCTSCVSGFEDVGTNFINEFRTKGMQFCSSEEFKWD